MKAVDAINSEHGVRVIYFGDLGGMKPQWAMQTGFRSSRYTDGIKAGTCPLRRLLVRDSLFPFHHWASKKRMAGSNSGNW